MPKGYRTDGKRSPLLGRPLPLGVRQKISQALLGKQNCLGRLISAETKRKISQAELGKFVSEETKAKISRAKSGRPLTEAHKAKSRLAHLGKHHKGWHFSEETKKKFASLWTEERRKEKSKLVSGANHPNWQGGISNKPYPFGFNKQLKETIRIRDGRACQLCSIDESSCLTRLTVHHINYVKQDISPMNLISLCSPCNLKVNRERAYYQIYFEAKIKEIYGNYSALIINEVEREN